MKKVGIKELLEIAYAIEKSGYNILMELSAKYKKNSGLSDIFIRMAMEEQDHIAKIQDFETKFQRHQDVFKELYAISTVKEHFNDFSHSHIMQAYRSYVKGLKRIRHEFEAVKICLNLEMDSIIFYERFLEYNRGDKAVDDLLQTLIHFELGHIEKLYQYMKNHPLKQGNNS
jgi:rubrerythrin